MGSNTETARTSGLPGKFPYSSFSADLDLMAPRTLAEVVAMTPTDMANASRLVSAAYNELPSRGQPRRFVLSPADDRVYRCTESNVS